LKDSRITLGRSIDVNTGGPTGEYDPLSVKFQYLLGVDCVG
jgi:hypothetical protein